MPGVGPVSKEGKETVVEAKVSAAITRRLSLNGDLAEIGNAFYEGGNQRVWVDIVPHFVANAALTSRVARMEQSSLRMREINHYRLDGGDPSTMASGTGVRSRDRRQIHRGVEFNLSLDNLTKRR